MARLKEAKEELKTVSTKARMAQIALDKCAEEFRYITGCPDTIARKDYISYNNRSGKKYGLPRIIQAVSLSFPEWLVVDV